MSIWGRTGRNSSSATLRLSCESTTIAEESEKVKKEIPSPKSGGSHSVSSRRLTGKTSRVYESDWAGEAKVIHSRLSACHRSACLLAYALLCWVVLRSGDSTLTVPTYHRASEGSASWQPFRRGQINTNTHQTEAPTIFMLTLLQHAETPTADSAPCAFAV